MSAAASAAPAPGDARTRIEAAALDLFEQQGYAATTVEAIASAAGVARRTFFLHFPSKDAVVFLHHEELSGRVAALLDASTDSAAVPAMCQAVRMVFGHYVEEPEIALRRYRIVKDVPELRAREIAWVQRYRVLFARFLHSRLDERPFGALEAEAMAGSFAAVHNHMLRRWLKDDLGPDPMGEFDTALAWLSSSFDTATRGGAPRRLVVAVFDEGTDPREILAQVEQATSR
ncbi:TetR/AcrR family transcriptional regulator [Longivirga aurantiaca]|uniref:TetR/AcrR family transcriptional regulator n=1 Tax=Longivirga aurantiaca TaxID=1837743 RepID=A0ABW1SX97_9ACTN